MTEDWEEPIEDDEDVMAVMGGMIDYLEGQDVATRHRLIGHMKTRCQGRVWLKVMAKKKSADWISGASKVVGKLPIRKKAKKNK
jgi:hypothetical protein